MELYRILDQRCGTNTPVDGSENVTVHLSPSILPSSPPSYGQTPFSYPQSASNIPPPSIPPRLPRDNVAIALYNFDAQRNDDLPFKKGDLIVITKRTNSQNDWWQGTCNGKSGNFPANYVKLE